MAGPKPSDSYNPTQTVGPDMGAPSDYATTKADPEAMGVGVAQSVQGLGKQIQQSASTMEQAQQAHLGIINEMAATNGEAAAAGKVADIQAKFRSLEGMAAVAALPQYKVDINKAYEETMGQMPSLNAQRSFSMLTARSRAYAIKDGGDYSATQFKAAIKATTNAGLQTAVDSLGNPDVAIDPERSHDALLSVQHFVQKKLQDDGMWAPGTTVGEDGNPVFPDTEDGKNSELQYKQLLSQEQGKAQVTRYKTLLDDPRVGANVAWDTFQQERGSMSAVAQAQILAMISPQVRDAQTRDVATSVMNKTLGNYHSDFDTPEEKTSGYNEEGVSAFVTGKIPGATITSTKRDKATNDRVNGATNSYHLIGQALDFVPPPGMSMQQAADQIREANPNLKVLVGGPDKDHPNEKPHVHIQWGHHGEMPTNDNGGFMSQADYLRRHEDDILTQIGDEAERRGLNPTLVEQAKARGRSLIEQKLQAQNDQDRADVDLVQQAVYGQFNNGAPLTSAEQLEMSTPEVKQAWHTIQMRDPIAAGNIIQHVLPSNAHRSNDYGMDYYKFYGMVENGQVTNPKDLWQYAGDNLTSSGIQSLTQEMANRKTPEGSAAAGQQYKFFQKLHNDATGNGMFPDLKSATLEKKFVAQMPQVLRAISAAKKAGIPPNKMFDPEDPNYVGNAFEMPDPKTVAEEYKKQVLLHTGTSLNDAEKAVNQTARDTQTTLKAIPDATKDMKTNGERNGYLLQLIKDGKLTKKEAKDYSIKQGWTVKAPDVPLAH